MSGEDEHGQQGPSTPAVGPLAVEAALLLDVVADRLTALKPETSGAESAGPTTGSTGPEGADGTHESTAGRPLGPDGRCPECGSVPGASCTACPLCRFLAILRGERPETTAKLVDGALLIVRALRTMIPDAPAPAGGSAGPGDPPPPPPARRGGFERIDIG
ncbi:MAG TPA: hypothetical protein PKY70_11910 [Nakamurella multipartita]|nr:hypothetical protein [Nakamurella multipartita]